MKQQPPTWWWCHTHDLITHLVFCIPKKETAPFGPNEVRLWSNQDWWNHPLGRPEHVSGEVRQGLLRTSHDLETRGAADRLMRMDHHVRAQTQEGLEPLHSPCLEGGCPS